MARQGHADEQLLLVPLDRGSSSPLAEPSKSSFPSGTGNQVLNSDLLVALDRLKGAFEGGDSTYRLCKTSIIAGL